jgi:hypothetical protein
VQIVLRLDYRGGLPFIEKHNSQSTRYPHNVTLGIEV